MTSYRWWRDAPRLVRRFSWRRFLLPLIVPAVLITDKNRLWSG
ncbi:MAG: hypothetical protein ACYS5V_09840 [Planctomycetota bacterium]